MRSRDIVDESLNMLPGCQSSFRLSDGSVFSMRASMSGSEWTRECQAVSAILGIPPEQNQATHGTEYVAKAIKNPHKGLLGDLMIYWLVMDFHPAAGKSIGTLMASVYTLPSEEGAHREPYVLYLEGFDAAFVAWAKMAEEELDQDEDLDRRHRTWEHTAKGLLNRWRSTIAQRLHQVTDDTLE